MNKMWYIDTKEYYIKVKINYSYIQHHGLISQTKFWSKESRQKNNHHHIIIIKLVTTETHIQFNTAAVFFFYFLFCIEV